MRTNSWQYILAILAVALPFVLIQTINPFSVAGPSFLVFYLALSIVVHLLEGWLPLLKGRLWLPWLVVLTGVVRMGQGTYNSKPIMYLLLMVILNISILLLFRRRVAAQ